MAEQWWAMCLVEGESGERKMAAEEQEVVAEDRGLRPYWRASRASRRCGRAVAGSWA